MIYPLHFRHLILLILPILVLVFFSCSHNTKEKHILIIHSYEPDYPAYKDVQAIYTKGFQQEDIPVSIFTFYLNCEEYFEKEEKDRIYALLNTLSNWKPDLIIVDDDQATYSLLCCEHSMLDTIPIVFTGVNYPNLPIIKKRPNTTGFWDKPDYKTNIELIERLIGKSMILRVMDSTFLDKKISQDMSEQLKDLYPILQTDRQKGTRLILGTKQKNITPLAELSKIYFDSTYIFTLQPRYSSSLMKSLAPSNYNKAYLATKREMTTLSLGRYCSFPSFSVINESVGYNGGFIGGYMTSLETQAKDAIQRASSLLKGTPISSFPSVTESSKNYIFDYPMVAQWGINWKYLPANSIFLNMPFVVRYQSYIIIISIFIGLFIIWILFYQRLQFRREALHKRQAQINLKKEKEFLSLALESGNIFAFRYSNGVFEFDNDFYISLDMPKRTITSLEFQNAIHPDQQDDFITNKHLLDIGFPSRKVTRRRYNFNGKGYQWWEFRYAQKKEDSSLANTIEVSGLCLNIQQIKENEEDLIKARKKAEEADQMKSTFLANMSHEIRTPLNAIVGFSELLTSDEILEPEERKEFIQVINKNSDLLLKLINDILDLSRIESGRMSFTFENYDLSELFNDIYRTHQLLMPTGVELRKETPAVPAIIRTDRHRLTQVITNFINNAGKFTSKGYILIKYDYSPDHQTILMSVSDTGKGIPKEKQAQVFERFQKLDEFAQGTGLGLAICQIIIKRFDGSIRLVSEEGKGSTFTITLPYVPGLTV